MTVDFYTPIVNQVLYPLITVNCACLIGKDKEY